MLTPTNYDSGLYHFSSIRWINEYAIVPGLGNLHGRLAFNQSFFTYVAALNPFFNAGRVVANSYLWLLTLITCVEVAVISLRHERGLVGWSVGLFSIPQLFYLAMTSNGVASPTPDFTCNLLQTALIVGLG